MARRYTTLEFYIDYPDEDHRMYEQRVELTVRILPPSDSRPGSSFDPPDPPEPGDVEVERGVWEATGKELTPQELKAIDGDWLWEKAMEALQAEDDPLNGNGPDE